MSITHKVEVQMDGAAHVWACKNPKFGESVMILTRKGCDDDYCNGYINVHFESVEAAEDADRCLTLLAEQYEKLYYQSLVKEMTIAEIEARLGHPVKIIK